MNIPLRSVSIASIAVNGYGRFKADVITLSTLGENNALAVKLMDRAGWK